MYNSISLAQFQLALHIRRIKFSATSSLACRNLAGRWYLSLVFPPNLQLGEGRNNDLYRKKLLSEPNYLPAALI